jgi:hypothetical protein
VNGSLATKQGGREMLYLSVEMKAKTERDKNRVKLLIQKIEKEGLGPIIRLSDGRDKTKIAIKGYPSPTIRMIKMLEKMPGVIKVDRTAKPLASYPSSF